MQADLATTNVLLGVMAAVSVLEALALVGLCVGGFVLYRRITRALVLFEATHVEPAAARVNAILDDVGSITAAMRGAADGTAGPVRNALAWIVQRIRMARRAA